MAEEIPINWSEALERQWTPVGEVVVYNAKTREALGLAYKCAHTFLQERLGYPPTFTEVADHLGEFGITKSTTSRVHSDLGFDLKSEYMKRENGKWYKTVELPDTTLHKRFGWPPER